MTESDYKYWKLIKEGDSHAFQEIYNMYADQMYGYGMKIVNNTLIVEDAIQTVFLNIYRLRNSISISTSLKAYLFTALKHQIILDNTKESKRLEKRNNNCDISQISEKYNFNIEIDHESSQIAQEENDYLIDIINDAISKLTPRQKEAIYLKYHRKLSGEEIAEIMNMDHQSVRTILLRARTAMRSNSEFAKAFRSILVLLVINYILFIKA